MTIIATDWSRLRHDLCWRCSWNIIIMMLHKHLNLRNSNENHTWYKWVKYRTLIQETGV